MQSVVKFLNEHPNGCLATVEEGKPKARPFGFMLEEGGKLYFCTAKTKEVYQQIKANPYVEFTSTSPEFAWIRLSGQVAFSNDLKIKEKIIENNELVKSIYQTADNPIFEIFYIERGKAVIADFSGQPPKEIQF